MPVFVFLLFGMGEFTYQRMLPGQPRFVRAAYCVLSAYDRTRLRYRSVIINRAPAHMTQKLHKQKAPLEGGAELRSR
jgi:hypothetical protein